MTCKQKQYLDTYLNTLNNNQIDPLSRISFEHFCADEFNANECAKLINNHQKRASCSLKSGYDIEGVPLPKAGDLTVVLDWQQNPVCIIQIERVETCAFKDVGQEFATLEGEGDKTLEWWKKAHQKFFDDYAQQLGITFTPDSILVLEYFNKIFPTDKSL
ncbi:ASCH domain-containing protein [Vibrio gallicus]|uniref:ASCH domain-containing protein n=1 Tax=Vibrio gallicus TaxID=190897 RepID=UPI0021C26973|nr:ASCH domain-containing protein [Vibrio gallicus]